MAGLVYFFSAKAFSISAIITAKIIYLGLGSVLGTELVSDLGSGSLSIFFIVEYQCF